MEQTPVRESRIKNLGFKVGVVLTLIPVLVLGLLLYALYARGVFDRTQKIFLLAPNAEGVSSGMQVMFSGFPIGQVTDMALTEQGEVRIEVRVKEKNLRWLRTSSEFTIEKPWFGQAWIRATSPKMNDPPLAARAERILVARDATQDLPQVIARANTVLENIEAITRSDSSFRLALDNLRTITERMSGENGILAGLTGSPDSARQLLETVEGVNALLASLNQVTRRADRLLGRTDEKMFGAGGVMDEAQQSLLQFGKMLIEARESLKKADVVLANAEAATAEMKRASGNVAAATTDLTALRSEVEDSIRKVNGLIGEINRKWPFARKSEIKLP
ncbi:MAG: MlaD family protein [Burkholderiales bacterium]